MNKKNLSSLGQNPLLTVAPLYLTFTK